MSSWSPVWWLPSFAFLTGTPFAGPSRPSCQALGKALGLCSGVRSDRSPWQHPLGLAVTVPFQTPGHCSWPRTPAPPLPAEQSLIVGLCVFFPVSEPVPCYCPGPQNVICPPGAGDLEQRNSPHSLGPPLLDLAGLQLARHAASPEVLGTPRPLQHLSREPPNAMGSECWTFLDPCTNMRCHS